MRKLCFIFGFIFIFLFPISATATEEQTAPYADAWELYQAWYDNYPDYISGIWSTNGGMHLTFGIVESADFEETKAEILAKIENDNSASFVQQKYSYNHLKQIQEYMDTFFTNYDPSLGLSSMGIYEMENCVHVDFLEDKKDDAAVIQFANALKEKYGDAIRISYSSAINTLEDIQFTPVVSFTQPAENTGTTLLWFICGAAVCLCTFFGVLVTKKRKTSILQTVTGQNITNNTHLTTRQTEQVVQEAVFTPRKEVDKKIQQ